MQIPMVFLCCLVQNIKALGIRTDLGGVQGLLDVVDQGLLVAGKRLHIGGQQPAGLYPALLGSGHAACKDGLRHSGRRYAKLQGLLAGPFAGALLPGAVQDHIHHGLAGLFIGLAENIRRNLDEIAVQYALVPFFEDLGHFRRRHAEQLTHQKVRFADQLHITVFNAVVCHLYIMAGAVRPYIIAARLAVGFSTDGTEDGADGLPGFLRAARHDAGAVERTLLAAGYAGAHIHKPGRLHLFGAANGIFKKGIASVNDEVAGGKQRQQLVDHGIHRLAGLYHQHDAARLFQKADEFLQRIAGRNAFFGHGLHKCFGFGRGPVIYSNFEPVARHVAHQVLAHHGQANQADFTFFRHDTTSYA